MSGSCVEDPSARIESIRVCGTPLSKIAIPSEVLMSHILSLELSDQVVTAITQQAEAVGMAPEQLAARLLEQRFGTASKPLPEIEKQAARTQFERHFGTLTLAQPTDLDNESIDADLAKEYASTHEIE